MVCFHNTCACTCWQSMSKGDHREIPALACWALQVYYYCMREFNCVKWCSTYAAIPDSVELLAFSVRMRTWLNLSLWTLSTYLEFSYWSCVGAVGQLLILQRYPWTGRRTSFQIISGLLNLCSSHAAGTVSHIWTSWVRPSFRNTTSAANL